MENSKKKKIKKKGFPIGIFMLLLILESIIASGAITAYYLYTGKKRIVDIEKYTRNYSITMAEAFTDVAELSYRAHKYSKLKSLFQEKIQENIIDEAFFVLKNGKLIVHSSKTVEKNLMGNIANDEFAYNLDLILYPVKTKSKKIHFSSYNIIGKKIPFNREQKRLLKQYVYKKINIPGWLISKAVYIRKKPVGTVNIIISKDRIFNFILSHFEECKKFLTYSLAGAFALSLFISIIIFIRYRSIQKKSIQLSQPGLPHVIGEQQEDEFITIELLNDIDDEKFIMEMEEDDLSFERQDRKKANAEMSVKVVPVLYDEETVWGSGQEIKDAIPLTKKV